jgi:hypothetical protein
MVPLAVGIHTDNNRSPRHPMPTGTQQRLPVAKGSRSDISYSSVTVTVTLLVLLQLLPVRLVYYLLLTKLSAGS